MKATLKNYRQAPRKVRLVAGLIRGKSVTEALAQLSFVPKRASDPIKKLISSAVANSGASADTLKVGKIWVDKGLTMKRSQPTARGRATPIHKHMSHVHVELEAATAEKKKKAPSKAKAK
ncbi:MAG TPA: 50S ribosomal protein L22 [Candidatus Paceibacterota bacterium]|nr:50S ribosomal protein L22 [Candidatus Paceibacterota bacterium]